MKKFLLSLLLLSVATINKPGAEQCMCSHLTAKNATIAAGLLLTTISHFLYPSSSDEAKKGEIHIPKLLPDHKLPFINKIGFAQLLPLASLARSNYYKQDPLWIAAKCAAWYAGGLELDKTQKHAISIEIKPLKNK